MKKMKKKVVAWLLVLVMVGAYLPAGTISKAADAATPKNLLQNGDFEDATNTAWLDASGEAIGAQQQVDKVIKTTVLSETYDDGVNGWSEGTITDGELSFGNGNTTVTHSLTGLKKGTTYTVSFAVHESNGWNTFQMYTEKTSSEKTTVTGDGSLTTKKTYTHTFTAAEASDTLVIWTSASPLYIDDLEVYSEEKVKTTEYVVDEKYDDGVHGWSEGTITDGELSFGNGNTTVTHSLTGLKSGTEYTVSFAAHETNGWCTFQVYTVGTSSNQTTVTGDGSLTTKKTYTHTFTATGETDTLVIWTNANPLYIDDLKVYCDGGYEQTYTEGIGDCAGTESSNVLSMKTNTLARQLVALTAGVQYKYTFDVKKVDAGDDFAFGIKSGSVTEDLTGKVTTEWTTVTGSFKAGADSDSFGFTRAGLGEVLIDNVSLTVGAVASVEDKGTFAIKPGEWSPMLNDSSQGYLTNLNLTADSLTNVESSAYLDPIIDYTGIAAGYITFGTLTAEELSDAGMVLRLIKGENRTPLVLQIEWGNAVSLITEGMTISFKKGLPVQFEENDQVCQVTLAEDYQFVRTANATNPNEFALCSMMVQKQPLVGDYDGDDSITANDVELCRMQLLGTLNAQKNVANANESTDGEINAADLVWEKLHEGDKLVLKHPMTDTINTANSLANMVQVGYDSAATKSAYYIQNQETTLTHDLKNTKNITSLTNKDGANYLEGATMKPYIVKGGSTLSEGEYFAGSEGCTTVHDARPNTTVMGYYYDSTYIRDLNWRWETDKSVFTSQRTIAEVLWLEKGYHTYSDKMYQTYRLVSDGFSNHEKAEAPTKVTGLTTFGLELKIPLSNITTYEIRTVSNTSVEPEWIGTSAGAAFEYIAIQTKNAGVLGLIFAGANQEGIDIDVTKTTTDLIIQQYITRSGDFADGDSIEFGHRLYTDMTDNFDGIRSANTEEQNPLDADNFTVDEATDGAAFTGYNHRTGYYEFDVDGYDFGEATVDPDKKFLANIQVTGEAGDRLAYLCVNTKSPLEGASIMDPDELQLPIPMQVNKNFGNENEEPVYAPEGTSEYVHGETFMPVCAEDGKTQEFTILNVMKNWGNYPLKQVSSIEYYTSYYHLSTGVMETNCISPFGAAVQQHANNQNNDFYDFAWLLPDFRGISGSGQWNGTSNDTIQKNSVGLVFAPTADKGLTMQTYTGSNIYSSGMTHADLDYTYASNDGKYDITMRHIEMPQTDESRTYYTIEFNFKEACTLDENFNIVAIGSRSENYTKAAYLAADGTEKSATPKTSGSEVLPLQKGGSYFTFYGLTETNQEDGNAAVIVKDYEIKQNGAASDVGLAFLNGSQSVQLNYSAGAAKTAINYGALTLNGRQSFAAGDSIKVNVVLLSYGETVQKDCGNVRAVYEDTVANALTVEASKGSVDATEHFLPTVIAKGNRAEFTLKNGTSNATPNVNYTIKVQGFTDLQRPVVYEKVNGEWQLFQYASFSGYDGYSIQMEDGRLTYSFVVTKGASDRTFLVTTREDALKAEFALTGIDLKRFDSSEMTVSEVAADGSVTLSSSANDPYILKKHLNYDVSEITQIQVKAKVSETVTMLSVFLAGDYEKGGIPGTQSDFAGGYDYWLTPSQCTDAEDGYKLFTFDISAGGWKKLTGFRIGFNGTGTMTIKEITCK